MATSKAAQRRAKAISMAGTRARRADGPSPEVSICHSVLLADKERLHRLARHWGTQVGVALGGAIRATEAQVLAGLDADAKARYFADTAQ